MNNTLPPENPTYAGLLKRLLAIFYDCFLLAAILFIVTAIATAFNQGNAIEPGDSLYPVYVFVIFALSYLYFAWFWIHNGQTLGMKTWRLQLIDSTNKKIGWKTTGIRFFAALFSWGFCGLGFFWSLIDKKNRCWHDLISNTELLDLKAQTKK